MLGVGLAQALGDADALVVARGRHAHVGDHDVGLRALDLGEQRRAVGAVGHDLEVLLMLHNLVDGLTHQERVVGERDADRAGPCGDAGDAATLLRPVKNPQPVPRFRENCCSAVFVFVCCWPERSMPSPARNARASTATWNISVGAHLVDSSRIREPSG